jgi:Ni,Fe-hydrogenase maturation factor
VAVPQLTPELAEAIRGADCVVFVDAAPCERVEVRGLSPAVCQGSLGHACDPRELLALAGALYGCRPDAWLLAVPASGFVYGTDLSPAAARGVAEAVDWIENLMGAGCRA